MRYMIYFRDKTTIHVSESVGKQVIAAKMDKAPGLIIGGACISTDFITIVKPIEKRWFGSDFVEQQDRIEKSDPDAIKMLSTQSSND